MSKFDDLVKQLAYQEKLSKKVSSLSEGDFTQEGLEEVLNSDSELEDFLKEEVLRETLAEKEAIESLEIEKGKVVSELLLYSFETYNKLKKLHITSVEKHLKPLLEKELKPLLERFLKKDDVIEKVLETFWEEADKIADKPYNVAELLNTAALYSNDNESKALSKASLEGQTKEQEATLKKEIGENLDTTIWEDLIDDLCEKHLKLRENKARLEAKVKYIRKKFADDIPEKPKEITSKSLREYKVTLKKWIKDTLHKKKEVQFYSKASETKGQALKREDIVFSLGKADLKNWGDNNKKDNKGHTNWSKVFGIILNNYSLQDENTHLLKQKVEFVLHKDFREKKIGDYFFANNQQLAEHLVQRLIERGEIEKNTSTTENPTIEFIESEQDLANAEKEEKLIKEFAENEEIRVEDVNDIVKTFEQDSERPRNVSNSQEKGEEFTEWLGKIYNLQQIKALRSNNNLFFHEVSSDLEKVLNASNDAVKTVLSTLISENSPDRLTDRELLDFISHNPNLNFTKEGVNQDDECIIAYQDFLLEKLEEKEKIACEEGGGKVRWFIVSSQEEGEHKRQEKVQPARSVTENEKVAVEEAPAPSRSSKKGLRFLSILDFPGKRSSKKKEGSPKAATTNSWLNGFKTPLRTGITFLSRRERSQSLVIVPIEEEKRGKIWKKKKGI